MSEPTHEQPSMSDEPTHEQPRVDVASPTSTKPKRRTRQQAFRALRAALAAAVMSVMMLFAVADLAAAAPWYWIALDAFCAVVWAIVLRRILRPVAPPPVCFNVYWVFGEPAFICLRPAGHRGRHREGCASWITPGGPYRICGRCR